MSTNYFMDKLKFFKENEKPEVVLLIADDEKLIKLIIAWTNTNIIYNNNIDEPDFEDEIEIWDWLWSNIEFSIEEIQLKSSLSMNIEHRLNFLIGNKAIYPDGTMNTFIQRYLRDKVLKYFNTDSKKVTKARK